MKNSPASPLTLCYFEHKRWVGTGIWEKGKLRLGTMRGDSEWGGSHARPGTLAAQLNALPLAVSDIFGSEIKHLCHHVPLVELTAALRSCFVDVLSAC